MRGLFKCFLIWLLVLPEACSTSQPDKTIEIRSGSDTLVSLESDSVKLTISLLGGAIVGFQNKINAVNPFSWKQAGDMNAENVKKTTVLHGHFLCVGRWGLPTPGEQKLGMPSNGEPLNNWWKLESRKGNKELTMNCEAPLDGLAVKRNVYLSLSDPLFKVTETITNELPIGRISTIVQNVFFSTPFFDQNMLLNSNATFGYNQARVLPDPYKHEYRWPKAFIDTLKISTNDLSHFSTKFRYISSHIFSDSIGWVTAYCPKLKLLLGYAWKTSEYPWLHIRNEISYDKPSLHGLAIATTGLGENYAVEERLTTTFHSVRNFEFIDAKSTLTKTWYCFLVNLPQGYEKTVNVSFHNDQVILRVSNEHGLKEYKLVL
jgi:hypothetical protein